MFDFRYRAVAAIKSRDGNRVFGRVPNQIHDGISARASAFGLVWRATRRSQQLHAPASHFRMAVAQHRQTGSRNGQGVQNHALVQGRVAAEQGQDAAGFEFTKGVRVAQMGLQK